MEVRARMTSTDDEKPREPVGGAGLYDIDPPQTGISQDPEVPVVGDVDALPDEVDF